MNYINEIIKPDFNLPVRFFFSDDKQPTVIPPHVHNNIEIMYILTGYITVTAGMDSKVLYPGDIMVFNSNEIHSTSAQNDCTTAYIIQIPSSYIREISTIPAETYFRIPLISSPSVELTPSQKDHIHQLQATIKRFFEYAECLTKEVYLYIFLKSILCDIIYQLFSHFQDQSANNNRALRINHKDFDRMLKIDQYIKEHYSENISLDEIAAHISLTTSYFSRYFSKVFGITFSGYLQSVRLEKAYSDLVTTNHPTNFISDHNGFSSYSLFHSKFKETYGCTPAKCRRKYAKIKVDSER